MIGDRLKAIGDMMICGNGGENAVVADIGSDHAYLPVWLYLNKKIKKAFAADISVNSVEKIKRNIEKYNISQEIIVPVLSNGLSAFDEELIYGADEVTHIVIAGMGGNNIVDILTASKLARQKMLLLQPNTKIEFLRRFLYENKFDITDECLSFDNGRFYVSMCAEYNNSANIGNISEADIIIGKHLIRKKPKGYDAYLSRHIMRLEKILLDLDKPNGKNSDIQTCYGFYNDVQNLISEMKKLR